MNTLPKSLRCVCASGHITLYPARERGHIPADCPDCGGHIVHLADAAFHSEPPECAAPGAAAMPSPGAALSALEVVDTPTRDEWLARVKATESSISYAAQIARDRKRRERSRLFWGWTGVVLAILAVVLAAGIAGGLD